MPTRTPLSPDDLKSRLAGALAFPVTPYAGDGSVDLAGVRSNATWLRESGVCAIVAPSGTGEAFSLTPDECAAVTRATVEAVGGRVPVIGAVGFNSRIGAELAREAEHSGADGLMILPPYYAGAGFEGLAQYYGAIAEATSLAVIPYARDGAAFTPDLIERLAGDIPNLIGFKDGQGDVRLFRRLLERVVERYGIGRLIWLAGVGDDLVGPYFAAGAQGFTSSLACFWPEASVELYRLASAGDFEGLGAFHRWAVHPLYELRQREKGLEVSIMKAAMDILGFPAGPVRPPLASASKEDRARLREILRRLGVPDALARARDATFIRPIPLAVARERPAPVG